MDRETQLISVIITTYNSENFIRETLNSVLNQTYQDFEIIVIDDQSIDNTAKIVKEYSEKDLRIKFKSIPHSGLPAIVRNAGIAAAKGEFIAFLDGDDKWEKHKLDEQIGRLKKNQDAVLVYSASVTIGGVNLLSPHYEVLPLVHKAAKTREDLIRKGNSIPLSSVLTRKSFLVKAGGFDEDPELKIEDFDLWLRLGELGRFIFIPRIHVFYRIHSNQFSSDWEIKRKRLQYLAEKRGLELAPYRFFRNKGFPFLILRNSIHLITFFLLKLIALVKR